MNEDQIKKIIEDSFQQLIKKYEKTKAFTDRKLTDTPTDSLSVVNRRFVTLNGTTTSRPTSSILGQYYFDITLGYPVYWNGITWVKYDGTTA